MKLVIRKAVKSDEAFIYSTWLRGLYYGNPWFREIDKDTFFTKYHAVLENILNKACVEIACLDEDSDTVLGYVVYRGSIMDWVFVKKSFRKIGIAKRLAPANITKVSHLTKIGKAVKPDEWKFDPFN